MNCELNSIFFLLLRSVICGNQIDEKEIGTLSDKAIQEMSLVARKHDVSHLLAYSLQNNNLLSSENKCFENEIIRAVYRHEQLKYEYKKLCSALEEYAVPFIPLKGAVMRAYYPETWMRTSCDIDILVRKNDVENIANYLVDQHGYTRSGQSFHDISLFSPHKIHIELHFTLMEDGIANASASILEMVWSTATQHDGYKYWHDMSDEMFYFYHIAHMAKHFITGGCGIKPFIDLYFLDRINNIEQEKRDMLLSEGGLLKFANTIRKLSRVWFNQETPDEVSEKMSAFILQGGVYGSSENRVILQQKKKGGKIGYILSRMFIPYSKLKSYYPILEKHKWLFPFMQIRRWGLLFNSKVAAMAKNEIVANNKVGKDNAEVMKDLMTDVGLK